MDDALQAFQNASGLSPGWISGMASAVLILLAICIYALCLIAQFKSARNIEFTNIALTVTRVIFVLGLIIACFAV